MFSGCAGLDDRAAKTRGPGSGAPARRTQATQRGMQRPQPGAAWPRQGVSGGGAGWSGGGPEGAQKPRTNQEHLCPDTAVGPGRTQGATHARGFAGRIVSPEPFDRFPKSGPLTPCARADGHKEGRQWRINRRRRDDQTSGRLSRGSHRLRVAPLSGAPGWAILRGSMRGGRSSQDLTPDGRGRSGLVRAHGARSAGGTGWTRPPRTRRTQMQRTWGSG
jgi:hypothetical protein